MLRSATFERDLSALAAFDREASIVLTSTGSSRSL